MLDDRYVAGLFDGEGCVRIARWANPKNGTVRHQIYVSLGVTHRPVVEMLRETYGGSVQINPHSRRNPKNRDQHVWVVTSKTAASFLPRILPHLVIKFDEVVVALEFQRTVSRRGQGVHVPAETIALREELRSRLANLKHRNCPQSTVAPWVRP